MRTVGAIAWSAVVMAMTAAGWARAAAPAAAAVPAKGPATRATVRVAEYRPKGILPADVRAFYEMQVKHLNDAEKQALLTECDNFRVRWGAFEQASEKTFYAAIMALNDADRAKVMAARKELVRLAPLYYSSFESYRGVIGKLRPENARKYAEFLMDYLAARDLWLKRTPDMVRAIPNVTAYKRTMMEALHATALKGSIDVRATLRVGINGWHDEVKKAGNDAAQLLAITRIMDYYERVDNRSAQRMIDQAPMVLGPDDQRAMQMQVFQRMPVRAEVE